MPSSETDSYTFNVCKRLKRFWMILKFHLCTLIRRIDRFLTFEVMKGLNFDTLNELDWLNLHGAI